MSPQNTQKISPMVQFLGACTAAAWGLYTAMMNQAPQPVLQPPVIYLVERPQEATGYVVRDDHACAEEIAASYPHAQVREVSVVESWKEDRHQVQVKDVRTGDVLPIDRLIKFDCL